jgi:hypothetical protein
MPSRVTKWHRSYWYSRNPPSPPGLQYLNRLEALGQLDWIVIDECHTILDSHPDFRPKMKAAEALMIKMEVQMVYLIATLPPADEPKFFSIVKAPEARTIPGPTTRPNLRYSVFKHNQDVEEITAVCDFLSFCMFSPDSSILNASCLPVYAGPIHSTIHLSCIERHDMSVSCKPERLCSKPNDIL